MLLSKTAKVGINKLNYQYYTDKGYEIKQHIDKDKHIRVPKGTYITVKIEDLPDNSSAKIQVKCDYCDKEITVKYRDYLKRHKIIDKDCCKDCTRLKITESNIVQYGTNSIKVIAELKGSKVGRNLKYSKKEILDYFESRGLMVQLDLMQNKNITVKDEIPYICKNHMDAGIQHVCYSALTMRNNCCVYGANEMASISQSQSSIKDVEILCKEKGYILLTEEIHNVDDKVEYICSQHQDYGIQSTSLWGLKTSDNSCKMCRQSLHSGENHWNWQGGIGLERDVMKETFEYKNWRKSVFERDNYTCQCCGETGIRLNAHHIKNYSSHPKLRLDINNGITLCEKCHSINIKGSFHSVYGTKNNNEEQLNEYIELHKSQKQAS